VFPTKGIVLKTIKYGETSLIAHLFTKDFGLQTYMVKGLRSTKKSSAHATVLQPSFVLDIVVSRQQNKNFQQIREMAPDPAFQSVQVDVVKNCIALYAMELLALLITEQDSLPDLFDFCYDFLKYLNAEQPISTALLPLYFSIQAARLSGYQIGGKYNAETPFLNLAEGCYTPVEATNGPFIEVECAQIFSVINGCGTINDLRTLSVRAATRKALLSYFLLFLEWHAPRFRPLKSLPVLSALLH
jgi:DNA repair protein RecO (recombination protein O)